MPRAEHPALVTLLAHFITAAARALAALILAM